MAIYEIKNLLSLSKTIHLDKEKPYNFNSRGIPYYYNTIQKINCFNCKLCEKNCPTEAIQIKDDQNFTINYGYCFQCGLCTDICPSNVLKLSNFNYVFSLRREELIVHYINSEFHPVEYPISKNVESFRRLCQGRGFNYREVAAGGNNTVEAELNASFNNYFDSEGYQVRCVASPKHADAIVFSGPISKNMEEPLRTAFACTPDPKALIAIGTEAISGGMFVFGSLPSKVDLFIAGDPPRPDVILNAFRFLMGVYKFSFQKEFLDRITQLTNICL